MSKIKTYKFKTTILEDGIIKIPEISKYKDQNVEIYIVLRPKTDDQNKTFEQWNEQFTDNQNLNEFIPEYGTTLKEFRENIYKAEMSKGMTVNEFKENLKKW